MKKTLFVYIIFGIFTLTGCDKLTAMINHKAANQQAIPETAAAVSATPVEDVQLAKIILKPKRHKLTITRDPFEPLIKPKNFDATSRSIEQQQNDDLKGMQYVGLVKVGDTISALIKTGTDKGVYKVNEQVNHLTITAIEESSITFIQGSKTFKLKRGDL